MSSPTFLSRISRLPLLAGAVAIGVGCAGRTPTPVTPASAGLAPQLPRAVEAVPPAPSVFDIKDMWYSQHVGAARLSSLSGGLLVVGFIESACGAPCVATLTSMRTIERGTDAGVHFVLVSSAAGSGTPAALAAFAKTKNLSANRYTVISGSSEGITNLTAALDGRSRPVTAAQHEASSMLFVLDFNGILVQQRGYGSVSPLLEALTLLSNIR